ncbi:branched-chain amino acid ABC transporter substrate-binding protein [Robbsia andropogonis]|nr:branched-chain amino acid ABC transporter substrate-binding protein [Robbsia andropogonis]MCP1119493.1 branched-chain amino acid ABC transporter substrate-binding protein [Robbsia andropogonis]MCP1129476.1 branched-chain amino acid ABC transporter substrate-binding protein [Robbsia andropogonis]
MEARDEMERSQAMSVMARCTSMGRRARRTVSVALLAWVAGTALPMTAHAQSTETVKIGYNGPLTGPLANYGKDQEQGAQLALDEANAQHLVIGGKTITFELIAQDDQGDPRVAVQGANRLVDQKVVAVVGHYGSGPTIAASSYYDKAGIPEIVPSASNPGISKHGYKLLYRPYGTDNTVATAASDYAVKELHLKRIAVVDDRTAYGQGLAEEFEKAVKADGGNMVAHEYIGDQDVDFRAVLTSLKGKRADLIFFAGLAPQGSMFVKQARQLGYKGALMAGASFANAKFLTLAGDAAEGMYAFEQGAQLNKTPEGQKFLTAFRTKYQGDSVGYAVFAYQSAWVVIEGMKAANSTDPKVFGPAIAKLSFDSVLGHITFNQYGDLRHAKTTLYKVTGGKWDAVKTVTSEE